MTYARLRPMRSPIFELIKMNAADTSASRAMADCTPLAVVCKSWTTAEIDTFISEVSTTRTNIAMASRSASLGFGVSCAPPRARAVRSRWDRPFVRRRCLMPDRIDDGPNRAHDAGVEVLPCFHPSFVEVGRPRCPQHLTSESPLECSPLPMQKAVKNGLGELLDDGVLAAARLQSRSNVVRPYLRSTPPSSALLTLGGLIADLAFACPPH